MVAARREAAVEGADAELDLVEDRRLEEVEPAAEVEREAVNEDIGFLEAG